jgi:hypothetical protein
MAIRGCADIKFLCGSDIGWQEASTLKWSAPKAFGVARFSNDGSANSIAGWIDSGRTVGWQPEIGFVPARF